MEPRRQFRTRCAAGRTIEVDPTLVTLVLGPGPDEALAILDCAACGLEEALPQSLAAAELLQQLGARLQFAEAPTLPLGAIDEASPPTG